MILGFECLFFKIESLTLMQETLHVVVALNVAKLVGHNLVY